MGLPSKLKNFNVFNDGNNYQGQVQEVTLPKLTRKLEDFRAGGMNGPIKLDYGQEGMSIECTYGGLMASVLKQWGVQTHDGVQMRFAGAYQAEDKATYDAVEVVIRGRHGEFDFGNAKPSDDTTFKVKTEVSYYKLTINGEDIIEIDLINMIEKVDGVDRLAGARSAIGL
jgi:P2 family phage contractile tail tube protein